MKEFVRVGAVVLGLLIVLVGCAQADGEFPSIEEDVMAHAEATARILDSAGVTFVELSVGQIECGDLPATDVFLLNVYGELAGASTDKEIEERLIAGFDRAGWRISERSDTEAGHNVEFVSRTEPKPSVGIMVSHAPITGAFSTGCYSGSVDDRSALEEELREMLVGN